ncbi:MAG: HEAT repeat domain-containing protein [Spirochaetales bacterium]|nr:HEAT repeat domain-containing protein [Spirochaetales bacterium]
MQTKFLSEEERREGKSRLYKFQAFNGLGFNFMGETPVYLLAMHFGASNIELGYISSVIFLTGIILLFLPRFLAGGNLIKVQSTAWFLRGIFVLLYLLLFFMEGRSAVILILVVYTLFCSARMIGVVIWNPLVRMVTTSQNRGEVLAMGNIANQTASVAAKLFSFLITSIQFFTGVAGILLLQIIGVIFNSSASWQLRQVACRDSVEYEKGRNIFVILGESLKRKDRFFPLMIKWIFISIMVINGLTIVFVRKEAGFGANVVFLYTMVIALANIVSGLFGRTFADRIGSRPLLIGMSLLMVLSYFAWMFLPLSTGEGLPWFVFFVLGFFSNFFMLSANVLIARVMVNSMPEKDNFGYNAMINFVMAIFSLLAGVTGGLLIDLGQQSTINLPNSFSFLFFSAAVLSAVLFVLSLFLREKGSLTPRETMSILFSLEGLRAYNYIGKLNATDDPVRKRTVIMSMSRNNAPIATEEIRSIMATPLSPVKAEVIKTLFSNPRPELLDDLLREAGDRGSYQQINAIFALGAYEGERVENLLLELLDHGDPLVRSHAAKSLSRIGYGEALEAIRVMACEAKQPWEKINYLIALKNMDPEGRIFSETFSVNENEESPMLKQSYFSLTAELFDMTPPLAEIYSSGNLDRGTGLDSFLEQARDRAQFYQFHRDLKEWFAASDWMAISQFCLQSLNDSDDKGGTGHSPMNNLKISVVSACERELRSYDEAIAAVYFTYQILINP